MPWTDWFMHGANILYALSYSVRKIFWLRVISVVAGLCFVPYFYFQPEPLWMPMYWSLIFVTLNLIHVCILLYERRPLNFNAEEKKIFQMVFRTLTPFEFKKLIKQGEWRSSSAGEKLVSNGERLDHVLLIFSGCAMVCVEEKQIAELRDGQFVGEMAFLTGDKASADVVAAIETKFVAWPIEKLRFFLKNHPDLQSALQLVIGTDLVNKLKKRH